MDRLSEFHRDDMYKYNINAVYRLCSSESQDQLVIAATSKIKEIPEPDN